jgi:hypothetical protein
MISPIARPLSTRDNINTKATLTFMPEDGYESTILLFERERERRYFLPYVVVKLIGCLKHV